MSSQLFRQFIQKRRVMLQKQGPPGPPPRQGLVWKPNTHRWIRPQGTDEYDRLGNEIPQEHTLGEIRTTRNYLANNFLDQATVLAEELKENSVAGKGATTRLMASLKGLERGEKYGLAILTDEVDGLLTDRRINERNSPTLHELKYALKSVRQEEEDSGLDEEQIHGGHDAEAPFQDVKYPRPARLSNEELAHLQERAEGDPRARKPTIGKTAMNDREAMNELLDEGQVTVKASRVDWLEQAISGQAYQRHGVTDSRLIVIESEGDLVKVGMRAFWK